MNYAPDLESDLIWLLQRTSQRLRNAVDEIARAEGLSGGLRDYVVLTTVLMRAHHSQIELARVIGLDKTTLMLTLDRLEKPGLIERRADPANRRITVPHGTTRGSRVQQRVTRKRAQLEMPPGFSATQMAQLRTLLLQLDTAAENAGMTFTGSCV